MSWFYAFAGFAALIILHEFGHFAVAKAVGMRVERFALFFPPLLFKVRRGETEYGIGAIPLGGYVRISGMNPAEELPPEVVPRAYYRQPVWKRIVVIAAGPAMNVLIAFVILWALFLSIGDQRLTNRIDTLERGYPAATVLRPGDRIVAVDGARGSQTVLRDQVASHRCAGTPVDGCAATTPARFTIARDGRTLNLSIRPIYDAGNARTRVGYSYAIDTRDVGAGGAARLSLRGMGRITTGTFSAFAHIFQKPDQLSGVVGSYEATRQSFKLDTQRAFEILAVISLSLALINLFPFLPLDGGHIFWAVAEKVRGRAIPFWVMERAGVVGFMLVIALFVVGLTNDIGRLTGEGFRVR